MIFDTHSHYDDKAFDKDQEEVLGLAHEAGVGLIVDPGCDAESSEAAIALAERFDFVYAAVGCHPEELASCSEEAYARIAELARHPKCVAIGEIGLDYYWDDTHKEEQKALFRRQIQLALELCKPIIVHDREAHGDCMEIVRDYPELRGVFHCYSGSVEMARELTKLGWYFSFGGTATFKNARKVPEVVASLPADRILLETDCPYLAPVPFRGRRCDSTMLPYTASAIAAFRGSTREEIEQLTWRNACAFFGIQDPSL